MHKLNQPQTTNKTEVRDAAPQIDEEDNCDLIIMVPTTDTANEPKRECAN